MNEIQIVITGRYFFDMKEGWSIVRLNEKKYEVRSDDLADYLSHYLDSGDEFKVTIDITKKSPATLWDGILEETPRK